MVRFLALWSRRSQPHARSLCWPLGREYSRCVEYDRVVGWLDYCPLICLYFARQTSGCAVGPIRGTPVFSRPGHFLPAHAVSIERIRVCDASYTHGVGPTHLLAQMSLTSVSEVAIPLRPLQPVHGKSDSCPLFSPIAPNSQNEI